MKTLILALLVLSSCRPYENETRSPEPPVIACMASQATGFIDDGTGEWSTYRLNASLDRDALGDQIKITMNREVMFDSCQLTSGAGFAMYPYDRTLYMSFDFKKNPAWRARYFDSQNNPKRSYVNFKIETSARCEDPWEEAFYSTGLTIDWSHHPGDCSPPGYYGTITVPL